MTVIIVLYSCRLQNPPDFLQTLVPVIHDTIWSGNRVAHLASFFSFLSLHPLVIYNQTDNLVGMSSQLGEWMGQFTFSTTCSISERIPRQHASKIYSMRSPDRTNDRCFAYGTHLTRDIFLQSPPFVVLVGMGCGQLSFESFHVLHQQSNFAPTYVYFYYCKSTICGLGYHAT